MTPETTYKFIGLIVSLIGGGALCVLVCAIVVLTLLHVYRKVLYSGKKVKAALAIHKEGSNFLGRLEGLQKEINHYKKVLGSMPINYHWITNQEGSKELCIRILRAAVTVDRGINDRYLVTIEDLTGEIAPVTHYMSWGELLEEFKIDPEDTTTMLDYDLKHAKYQV